MTEHRNGLDTTRTAPFINLIYYISLPRILRRVLSRRNGCGVHEMKVLLTRQENWDRAICAYKRSNWICPHFGSTIVSFPGCFVVALQAGHETRSTTVPVYTCIYIYGLCRAQLVYVGTAAVVDTELTRLSRTIWRRRGMPNLILTNC